MGPELPRGMCTLSAPVGHRVECPLFAVVAPGTIGVGTEEIVPDARAQPLSHETRAEAA